MQVGALAKTQNGEYVQVVGDFVVPLNKRKIETALTKAGGSSDAGPAARSPNKAAPPPVVTVKRRRIPVMA